MTLSLLWPDRLKSSPTRRILSTSYSFQAQIREIFGTKSGSDQTLEVESPARYTLCSGVLRTIKVIFSRLSEIKDFQFWIRDEEQFLLFCVWASEPYCVE